MVIDGKEYGKEWYDKTILLAEKVNELLSANLIVNGVEYPVSERTQADLNALVTLGVSSKWTCLVDGKRKRVFHTADELKAVFLAGKQRKDSVKEWEELKLAEILATETLEELEAVEI